MSLNKLWQWVQLEYKGTYMWPTNSSFQLIYLFIKLDWALQIANTKHYLTEWLRSWTSLDKLKNIIIRILHKGNDRFSTFNRARLSSDLATLGPDVFNQFVNLNVQGMHNSTSALKQKSHQHSFKNIKLNLHLELQ